MSQPRPAAYSTIAELSYASEPVRQTAHQGVVASVEDLGAALFEATASRPVYGNVVQFQS
jgi:hypothetical protein